jgi:hypothetical protein
MFDTDKIKICKLANNEYVIATVDEDYATNVISLALSRTAEGGISVNFAPFMFPFNEKFTGKNIKASAVICTEEPSQELYESYVQATTGIIPATTVPEELKKKGKLELIKG